ncbi:VirB3 family type IV secretion system protein (plasmid) [Ampullimonas aquatilis]|uniref:VirB3 family type IV secretion system protein n=1 Tax=Ampullimonas aquatilis TaxID=1341549 RepID=UPI003C716C66
MLHFILLTGLTLLLAFWAAYFLTPYLSLFLFMVYIPLIMTLRQITKKDDQRLKQTLLKARLRIRMSASREKWGSYSYSPISYKKRPAK